jgi:hypothetical protein
MGIGVQPVTEEAWTAIIKLGREGGWEAILPSKNGRKKENGGNKEDERSNDLLAEGETKQTSTEVGVNGEAKEALMEEVEEEQTEKKTSLKQEVEEEAHEEVKRKRSRRNLPRSSDTPSGKRTKR